MENKPNSSNINRQHVVIINHRKSKSKNFITKIKSIMKKLKSIFGAGLTFLSIVSCTRVPVTSRGQLKLQPESDMIKMSLVQYNNELSNNAIIQGTKESAMVEYVGKKIADAARSITTNKGAIKRISKYRWEYSLLDNDQVNAWCLPGGKIAVYSGILPIAQDEAGLAAVMAHEVAHAIAQHGNERMSQVKLVRFGSIALTTATASKGLQTQQYFQAAFGIGTQFGILLPFSRLHETEADKIGMVLMAKAGYDPHEFINFFERMNAQSQSKEHSFFSTHPTNAKRIQVQKEFLKEALKYYHN